MADAVGPEEVAAAESATDEVPEPPVNPVTRAGDIWVIGRHRLICGDCRDLAVVKAVLGGVAVTWPSPRRRTPRSASTIRRAASSRSRGRVRGLVRAVAGNVQAVLAADGSWFVNIKAHAENGERHLYTLDLVIAHKREWGWRYVDEFCWRKTDNGVPGGWPNRFKTLGNRYITYAARPKSNSTRWLVAPRRTIASTTRRTILNQPRGAVCWGRSTRCTRFATTERRAGVGAHAQEDDGRQARGYCTPIKRHRVHNGEQPGFAQRALPRPLVEFFVKSFSDAGDAILDPLCCP